MPTWFTTLFSGGVSTVIDSVGSAVDKLVTSDQERLQLKNELVKIQAEANQKAEDQALQAESMMTDRWKSDNEHVITRLVRPLTYTWVIVLFTSIILGDGNWGFNVKPAYIPVIETLLTTMTIAYFGSRGAEKISATFRK